MGAIVPRDYLGSDKVIQEVIDVVCVRNIVVVVAVRKRESEEPKGVSFSIGLKAALARKCGSKISLKYISKRFEFLTEMFNKTKKKLAGIFLSILIHIGFFALRYIYSSRKTSKSI